MRKLLTNLLIITLLGILLICCKQEKQSNILFIAVDALRSELGCYGNPVIKSLNLDKLASAKPEIVKELMPVLEKGNTGLYNTENQ